MDALKRTDLLQKLLRLTRSLVTIRSETLLIVNIVRFLVSIFNYPRDLGLQVSAGNVSGLYHV